MTRLPRLALPLVAVLAVTAGCTATDEPAASDGGTSTASTAPTPSTTPEPPATEPDEPESDQPDSRPRDPKPHPISVETLIERRYNGRGLRVGQVLGEFGAYTRFAVTYRSEDLRISGIMNVPAGRGPFPVLVLNHGYIEPAIYVTEQGLAREQDWLARREYVVLHTDYRNHAGSDNDPNVDYELRLPYAVDVVNAVRAVKRSDLPYLDRDGVGLLGRSMGGNVTFNALVARPGLAADNWRQFYQPSEDRSDVNARMARTYGLPAESPEFWRAASPRRYLDRLEQPVLMHHGALDDSCPLAWSRATVRAMREQGQRVRLATYAGEGHTLYAQWPRSMMRTTAFFDQNLA